MKIVPSHPLLCCFLLCLLRRRRCIINIFKITSSVCNISGCNQPKVSYREDERGESLASPDRSDCVFLRHSSQNGLFIYLGSFPSSRRLRLQQQHFNPPTHACPGEHMLRGEQNYITKKKTSRWHKWGSWVERKGGVVVSGGQRTQPARTQAKQDLLGRTPTSG